MTIAWPGAIIDRKLSDVLPLSRALILLDKQYVYLPSNDHIICIIVISYV